MRVPTKFGLATATILAAIIGITSLAQAALSAGSVDTVLAVRTNEPVEALIQKVHKTGYPHHHGTPHHKTYHHHYYHHHHHYHHHH